MDKLKEKVIKDAQYRKNASISYFNSVNNAIALITPMIDKGTDLNAVKDTIVDLRDWFLDEHAKYHATVIANIGVNYDVKSAIEKINASKDVTELGKVWIALSEDERRDAEILSAKDLKQVAITKK